MLDSTFGRSELRLSNIHVPGAGAACSTSRCTLGQGLAHLRADAGANPDVYEFLEAEQIKYAIRLPANRALHARIGYLLKRPVGRPPNEVGGFRANFHYQAGSWTKPRRVPKYRVASRRALSAHWVHRH